MSKEASFSSAGGTFPVKIVHNNMLMRGIREGRIPPVHLQLNPTNRCDLKCKFCSCSRRDRDIELPFDVLAKTLEAFKHMSCQAVTITGGGEPLLYGRFSEMLNVMVDNLHMEAGLVTNGRHLQDFTPETWEALTWIRISVSDETPVADLLSTIKPIIQGQTDWSFSYVITQSPNPDSLARCIRFARENDFTHIRVVSDILNSGVKLAGIREEIRRIGEDSDIVIWQDRSNYGPGTARCLISLLKPVLGADGGIYPCCGAQYAKAGETGDYPRSMLMASVYDAESPFEDLWTLQNHFDGSSCDKCYYQHYNDLLEALLTKPQHGSFV